MVVLTIIFPGSFYDAKGIWKFTVEYQANDFVEKKFYIK